MKKTIISIFCFLLLIFCTTQKVRIERDMFSYEGPKMVFFNGVEWGILKTEYYGKKYTLSTLDGYEYIMFTYNEVIAGTYVNEGKTRMATEDYITVKFFGVDLDPFEIISIPTHTLVNWLIDTKVIINGKYNPENAMKFKERYQEDISGKYRKNTKVIINE